LSEPYNPLDKLHLGESVRDALLRQPVTRLPPSERFAGAGIYALYYTGDFPAYRRIAELNADGAYRAPIYVGEAVPEGARKGGLLDPTKTLKLNARLREHARSIEQAENLRVEDFQCRFLIVDDIWIPLGEALMIHTFAPVWNKVIDGFGIHTPGAGRGKQMISAWDTLHPGRAFVNKLALPANPKRPEQLIKDVEEFLALPPRAQLARPTVEAGDDDE
jgi:Eco29kI restriction endonuclease